MRYKYSKVALSLCSSLALLAMSGAVMADSNDQPAASNTSPVMVPNNTDGQATETVNRVITVVSPEDGQKTVINQTANRIPTADGDRSNVWPEYFPPSYAGYRPSQTEVNAAVVSPKAAPARVTITYRPLKESDVGKSCVAFFFVDVDGRDSPEHTTTVADAKGVVTTPAAPDGWEYVNRNLPTDFTFYRSEHGNFIYLLVQKKLDKSDQPETFTKEITRKIIFHLPMGDQVVEQTATATKDDNGWRVEPFAAVPAPKVAGFQSSLLTVPAKTLDALELDTPQLVEVNYTRIAVPDQSHDQDEDKTRVDNQPELKPKQPIEKDEGKPVAIPDKPSENPTGDSNPGGETGRQTVKDGKWTDKYMPVTGDDQLANKLQQLQEPLNQLDSQTSKEVPAALPQTGNHFSKLMQVIGFVLLGGFSLCLRWWRRNLWPF